MHPAVSVITPVYNNALFLPEAIESVLAQTDFPDWELLIVDDGSTDASLETAARYGAIDKRIKVLQHPGGVHCGSSASRNLAISRSRGEFIALLDADDVWLPGKLRYQVEALQAFSSAAMTYGAAERWYSWSPIALDADYTPAAEVTGCGTDTVTPPPELLRTYLADESRTPCTCSVLARRDAVLDVGGFEEAFPGLYDDQVFYAKISLRNPVHVSSRCVARYRKHPASCCARALAERRADAGRDRFLHWLRVYTCGEWA